MIIRLTCTSIKFAVIMLHCSLESFIFPKFASVESRDANVISKFPFSPNRAGTNTIISGTSIKTFHLWNKLYSSILIQHSSLDTVFSNIL